MFEANGCWVVYSPNESAISDSAGFWSQFDQATRFSTGGDARLVPWQEAQQHYG
ncbi:TPA: hypothetical protein ACU6G1_000447 [Pseudomonas aeruginosa]